MRQTLLGAHSWTGRKLDRKEGGAIAAVDLTFVFLRIGAFGGNETMTKVRGWPGLLTAALAWYASFAGVTNSTGKRVVQPVFPRL